MRRSAMLFALGGTLGSPACSDPPTGYAGVGEEPVEAGKPTEVEQPDVHAPGVLATAPAVVNDSDYGPVWTRAQCGTSTGR